MIIVISSKDIQQIDNMLKMLNEMVEGVKVKREGKKIGRNDPCPCGSGKKYKYCCGRNK